LKKYIKISKPIRFDGNNYSDEWKEEAKFRGLDCETSVPKILKAYTNEESIKIFTSTNVMSEKELHARNEVKWDMYTKKIQIESRVLGDLAINHIIPIATRYQSILLDNVNKMKTVFSKEEAEKMCQLDLQLIKEIAERVNTIKSDVDNMIEARKRANVIECEEEKANTYHDAVLPFFDKIRYQVDKLEMIIDDEMWPLPKYRELLFIR